MNHKPITLDFGGWKAPFGIQFLGDSLSLLMVTVSSFVVTLIMAYGFGRGEKRVIVSIYQHLSYYSLLV